MGSSHPQGAGVGHGEGLEQVGGAHLGGEGGGGSLTHGGEGGAHEVEGEGGEEGGGAGLLGVALHNLGLG